MTKWRAWGIVGAFMVVGGEGIRRGFLVILSLISSSGVSFSLVAGYA